MTEKEAEIQQKIMLEIGSKPENLISRRNVGDFTTKDGRYIRIGTKGEADLQGVIGNQKCGFCGFPVHPKPIAIEVKDKDGKQSPDQILWQNETWERRGLLFILARSVDDVINGINKDKT